MLKYAAFALLGASFLVACNPPNQVVTPDTTPPQLTLSATPSVVTDVVVPIELKAEANDNVGVTRVTFYRGQTKLAEDTQAPYEATDNLYDPRNLVYRAVAEDAAGNKTEKTVELKLYDNPPPTPTPDPTPMPTPTPTPTQQGFPALKVQFSKAARGTGQDSQGIGQTVRFYGQKDVSSTAILLSSGTVAQNLSLTLAPISETQLEPVLTVFNSLGAQAGCQGTISFSTTELRLLSNSTFTFGPDSASERPMYLLNPDGSKPTGNTAYPGGYPNALLYADRAGDVTGTTTCATPFGNATYNADIHFQKGWNFVQYSYAEGTNSSTLTTRTLSTSTVILAPITLN